MINNKEIYLAGAMGCYPLNDPYPIIWRKEVEARIDTTSPPTKDYHLGLSCFNPVKFYNYNNHTEKSQKEIMLYEFQRLEKESDILLVNLKDLDKSIGTSDEILLAWKLNKPIIAFYEECESEEELIERVHPFKLSQISRVEYGEGALDRAMDYIRRYYGRVQRRLS